MRRGASSPRSRPTSPRRHTAAPSTCSISCQSRIGPIRISKQFSSDRPKLQRELADRIREQGDRPTPKLIERELARIERARAALDAIEAIERAGGRVHWHQVDLTDARQVSKAVTAAAKASDRIDVVLHCAGLEISHFLPDKPQAEYDLVFDVKAHGWLNLLAALRRAGLAEDRAPGTAIVFSSIAGRFGNGGQTDYSAANDLLCKSVSNMRQSGHTRGIAIDWTAWAQIGMASRGSIPKMMEAAGIEMLPPEVGIPAVHRELAAAGAGGEVVVAGSLGVMQAGAPSDGRSGRRSWRPPRCPSMRGRWPARSPAFAADGTVSIVTELDPAHQAFLGDHRIDGTPVLPGVMGMEGFAETAQALVPGFEVVALEDVDLLAPFKFYKDEPRKLILRARLRDGGDGAPVADCELIGRRTLPGKGEQETRHFVGRARLARKRPSAPKAAVKPAAEKKGNVGVGQDAVYRIYFHGPAYQVIDRAWREDGHVIGSLADEAASRPRAVEPANGVCPAADRAVLPDRGRLGARDDGPDGAADPRRSGRAVPGRPQARPAVGSRQSARRLRRCGRRRCTPGVCACDSRDIARPSYRARSTPTPWRRSDPRCRTSEGRSCNARSHASRLSIAASPRCG